ncbi:hypothetical protein [Streptomyces neyagawaensis]|uniref:Uncharacterized protein n=1 Tax=Streptomyces neyagawaensis TaxID=42238 RepID=A0ABV3B0Z7_9ACTN
MPRRIVSARTDLNRTVEALAAATYSRVELVEKRGEFAVRVVLPAGLPPAGLPPDQVAPGPARR